MGTTVAVKRYNKRPVGEQAKIDRVAREFRGQKRVTLAGRTVYRFRNHTAAARFAALAH